MMKDNSGDITIDDATRASRNRARGRLLRAQPVALMIAAVLLVAACGGASSTSSTGSAASAGSSRAGGSTDYQQKVAFAQCMRSHGVPNFPDPASNGVFVNKGNFSLDSPQAKAASKVCAHLLPNGGVPTQAQQQHATSQMLQLAHCMRSHGVPNFPDPKNAGGHSGLSLRGSGINPQAPQFQAAQRACQSLGPGGAG
jgi:hypothetical protein